MRQRTAASMVLVVAVLLVATGCVSARVAPPGPTDTDRAAVLATRLNQAWVNTGLDGVIERPQVDQVEIENDDDAFVVLSDCLTSRGYDGFGYSDGPDGIEFISMDGSALSAQSQLDFYTCFAMAPTPLGSTTPMMSPAQLDYLYDYYEDWVIPCLGRSGVMVEAVPSRTLYLADPYGTWTPYEATILGGSGLGYDAAVARCGEPHAGILPERAPGGFSTTSLQQ